MKLLTWKQTGVFNKLHKTHFAFELNEIELLKDVRKLTEIFIAA